MSIFVESLKRLFGDSKISEDRLQELLRNKKITQSDYDYITNK